MFRPIWGQYSPTGVSDVDRNFDPFFEEGLTGGLPECFQPVDPSINAMLSNLPPIDWSVKRVDEVQGQAKRPSPWRLGRASSTDMPAPVVPAPVAPVVHAPVAPVVAAPVAAAAVAPKSRSKRRAALDNLRALKRTSQRVAVPSRIACNLLWR